MASTILSVADHIQAAWRCAPGQGTGQLTVAMTTVVEIAAAVGIHRHRVISGTVIQRRRGLRALISMR
jgi:hypothetical protein